MNPEEATRAFMDLDAARFIAMHWGTFKLTDEPLHEPPERLAAEWRRRGLERQRCHAPAIGESLDVVDVTKATRADAETRIPLALR